MADVLLVEDTPSDASLAVIAIALRHPRTRVYEVRDVKAALHLIAAGHKPRLVVLGWRALKEVPAKLGRAECPFVGFASDLTEADRRRALEAGVKAIYERPQEWRRFCDALEALLDEWLAPRAA